MNPTGKYTTHRQLLTIFLIGVFNVCIREMFSGFNVVVKTDTMSDPRSAEAQKKANK